MVLACSTAELSFPFLPRDSRRMDAKDNYERSTIDLQAAPVAETDGQTSAESAEACTTKAFPKLLPMQNEYTADKYYVRACYPEYYEVVMDLLRTKKGVVATGTPGIGTSLFMAYFYQRYSREHSNETIRIASYSSKSIVRNVATARGGNVIKVVRYKPGTAGETVYEPTGVPESKEALWLLDGPPPAIPEADRWVSFTCPSEEWTSELASNSTTCAIVYMPVWTLEELRAAAIELDRTELLVAITNDQADDIGVKLNAWGKSVTRPSVLESRFGVFGGVPRFCFEADRVAIRNAVRSCRTEASGLTAEAVRDAMTARVVPMHAHRVLHYDPVEYREAVVRLASEMVTRALVERGHGNWEDQKTRFEPTQQRLGAIPGMRMAFLPSLG